MIVTTEIVTSKTITPIRIFSVRQISSLRSSRVTSVGIFDYSHAIQNEY
jgi:hypothetical protein